MDKVTLEQLGAPLTQSAVFCKTFLAKIAKHFWRMLHLQIGESCKASGQPIISQSNSVGW